MCHSNNTHSEETESNDRLPRFPYRLRQPYPTPYTLSQLNPRVAPYTPQGIVPQAAGSNDPAPSSSQSIHSPYTREDISEPLPVPPPLACFPPSRSPEYPSSGPPPPAMTLAPDDPSMTLVVMYKNSHFFLTVPLSIKFDELKAEIREKLRVLGPDQNIGDIIPEHLAIGSLTVQWDVIRFRHTRNFPHRTIINDQNIEELLRFMKEKKTEFEVVRVETGGEIQDQTEDMEDMKKKGAFAR